ncbi:hypothetical protein V6N12_059946 [Hibiscus sabdariffa]|uniref:Cation/H+ exchanger transmembrane domain-containing protein n=1 Tax=Hibiscus sabdariffa TaxID=183260 RepID=A0ABR2D312_9ROSI
MLQETTSSSSSEPVDAVIFFGISLVSGIACRHLLRGTRVPYTVALLIIGLALGSLEFGASHKLGRIGDGIRIWNNIDPDLLLAVFLPALLFESAFSMEVHQIKRCMVQMLLLAGPGVLISTFCLGSALKLTFPYEWNWKTSLLLGGLLSATDPVAVVALLKELGASKKLSTIIEGESLMNDGTAIVVYQLFYRMVLGQSFSWDAIIEFLAKVSLGAVGIGIAFGIASVLWLGFIFNDTVIEITLTLAVSYIVYFTGQKGIGVSGVLAVMTLGMFYAAVAKTAFKGDGQQSLHHFWEMVSYIANTLIFILSGVVIAEGILGDDKIFHNNEHSWGYLVLLYIFVQRTSDGSPYISSQTGNLFVFFTGGIVFLTLIVNGSTTQFILHFLDMDKLSAAKKRILDYTKYEMLNKAFEAFEDLGDDEELGPVDWPTVKRYIASLNDLEGGHVHPHTESEADNNLDPSNLKDIRVRLLNGVLNQHTGECLMKGEFHKTSMFPQKLIMYFIVERLENACCVCAAFLRAHRIARRQLHEFIGDSVVASTVISESEAEGEEARKFLEEVRTIFPQVLRVVKTRQVTYSVLDHLIDYLQNLEKVGLLEEKEMLRLHDAVQTDLKKLLRDPPLVKIPKLNDLISAHPLLGALPSTARETLQEGSKPNGVWLISNGVVKWTSKSIRNKHSVHPTFTHGSTLGFAKVGSAVEDFLWQESAIVLAKLLVPQIFEKMALQDLRALVAERSSMNTYITGETIEVSHQSIGFLLEGFIKPLLVQEELIASPAVLSPSQRNQSFSNADKSGDIIIVLSGATASFSHQRSGYQLETRGSIIYQVETRARVIIFDIATLEANRVLRRNSSSFNHSHKTLNREHGGLMSWPEHFFRARQHAQNHEASDQQVNRLSARAMQLSIFGSMPAYNLSYDRHPLVSVRSEGSVTLRKNLKEGKQFTRRVPPGQVKDMDSKEGQVNDDSSDDSVAEDEILVRIDSPSGLSFNRAS